MKYRALDAVGDYSFGRGTSEILVNSPECVAQAVKTRLLLAQGEWFLDDQEGTPYATQILGTGTAGLYDAAIRKRILDTPGVTGILNYQSHRDQARALTVACTINTLYGVAPILQVL